MQHTTTKRTMAGSPQEYLLQRQKEAQFIRPNEVERAIAEWQQEQIARRKGQWRGALARTLIALASRISPSVAVPAPHTPALAK